MSQTYTLLDDCKVALRISHSGLDRDIQQYINTCKDDLARVGILASKIIDTDVRVIEACKLYCQARMDYMGKGTQYYQAYEDFRTSMALNEEYTKETPNV